MFILINGTVTSSISWAFPLGLLTDFLLLDPLRDWANYILILFVHELHIFTLLHFTILMFILGLLSLQLFFFPSGGGEKSCSKKSDYAFILTNYPLSNVKFKYFGTISLLHLMLGTVLVCCIISAYVYCMVIIF